MALSFGLLRLWLCLLVLAASASASGECERTATEAPKACVKELIEGIAAGDNRPISEACCQDLACVREATCAPILRQHCTPQGMSRCPLPPGDFTGADCRRTARGARRECVQEFIQAMAAGGNRPISSTCCQNLACVGEATCVVILREHCAPRDMSRCPLPPTLYAAARA